MTTFIEGSNNSENIHIEYVDANALMTKIRTTHGLKDDVLNTEIQRKI